MSGRLSGHVSDSLFSWIASNQDPWLCHNVIPLRIRDDRCNSGSIGDRTDTSAGRVDSQGGLRGEHQGYTQGPLVSKR